MRKPICLVAALLVAVGLTAPAAHAASCGYPEDKWDQREPTELGLDAARLQETLDWANTHTSESIAVYRHGCLAGASRLDAVTAEVPWDGWSMTKSVTSLLAGRAVTLGKLNIEKPIARYYPQADRDHGSLLPRHLLTMTTGTHRNWVRDLSPQYDRVRDALSLPFDHKPGTFWEYQQSNVSLMLGAVQRAVGSKDIQEWAQRELFGPIGIPAGSWTWDRDRSGNTEGWAHLHMRGQDWARLGYLMLHKGRWNGRQLISKAYVKKAITPGKVNNAYGYFWWLNGGGKYVLPNVEGADTGRGKIVATGPKDMYLMAGSGEQRVYVIPSRDMVIVRLGERGSREGDTRASVWTGRGGELDSELIRRTLRSVTDVAYDDPGPYKGSDPYLPPLDDGIAGDVRDTDNVAAGSGAGPDAPAGCTPVSCE